MAASALAHGLGAVTVVSEDVRPAVADRINFWVSQSQPFRHLENFR